MDAELSQIYDAQIYFIDIQLCLFILQLNYLFIQKKEDEGCQILLFSMLLTVNVSTFLVCRGPAFFERTATKPTVRMAGHDLRVDQLVWAARNSLKGKVKVK